MVKSNLNKIQSKYDATDFECQTDEVIHNTFCTLMSDHGVKLKVWYVEKTLIPETDNKTNSSINGACRQFLKLHSKQIRIDIEQLDISETTVYRTFHSTVHAMFSDCIR